MNPPRHLLAATDFSGPARHALERAAWLAGETGAALTLLHVLNRLALEHLRDLLGSDGEAVSARLEARAEADLAALAGQRAARARGPVATRLARGRAVREIPTALDATVADQLVMGARGANFVREFLLGSTTERVLRKLRRPVLAVKQRPRDTYRHVLVPVDFSAHAVPAVRAAHVIAPTAEITVLHAFEVDYEGKLQFAGIAEEVIERYRLRAKQEALSMLDALCASVDVPAERLTREVAHGPATQRILEKEQELGADLIVIGKHGQSALEEMLLGSVTKHLLAYSDCDVLVTGLDGAGDGA